MRALRTFIIMSVAAVTAICVSATGLLAETLDSALAKAYQDNPQLNAQRALVRATDENVPQALSGYRPKVAVTAAAGYQYTDSKSSAFGTATDFHGAQTPL